MMNLRGSLMQLETAQLVRRLSEDETDFLFKHTLVQETAYASLLKESRHVIHRRVAESVEALYPNQLDENAVLLAHHYAEGQDDDKALAYAIRAGDVASRIYANEEAITQYTNALEIAKRTKSSSRQLLDIYARRGRRYELMGKYDKALENYAEMEQVALRDHDQPLELGALIARAIVHSTPNALFNPALARELADRSLALAHELDDNVSKARVLWILMLINHFTGKYAEAINYGEQSVTLARELNLREQLAFSLNDISRAYLATHQLERANNALGEARDLWRVLDNKPMLADNLNTLATVVTGTGRYDEALAISAEADDLGRTINNQWVRAHSHMASSVIHWDRGEIETAIISMKEAISWADQVGFFFGAVQSRLFLSKVYTEIGDIESASEVVSSAAPASDFQRVWEGLRVGLLAHIYIQKGDLDQAKALLDQAKTAWEPLPQGPAPVVSTQMAEFELAMAVHDLERAFELAEKISDFTSSTGLPSFKIMGLVTMSRAFVAQGRIAEAELLLNDARTESERVGSRRELWRILGMLGDIQEKRGNTSRATDLYAHARQVIDFIAAHVPLKNRDLFLNLPEVRKVMDANARV